MKKKILILGVTGQDGSLLADYLTEKKYQVFGLIRKSSNRNYDNIKNIINKLILNTKSPCKDPT